MMPPAAIQNPAQNPAQNLAQSPAADTRKPALAFWRLGDGAPPSGPFVALVPGDAAPLLTVALPDTLRGPARLDVARRQVLDRLGSGARDLDIRAAPLGSTATWARVAVADRAQVLRWRSALGAGAARCRGLLPDYAALPTATGLWTLSHDGGVLRARLGPTDGFSAEVGLAAAMLSRALAQKPRAVLWLGPPDAELEGILGDLPVHRSAGALPADLRPQLLTQGELALNFARDPQADAQAVTQALRRLMWPALLFVLGAAGWGSAQLMGARQDTAAAELVLAQTEAAARRDLLGEAPLVDLRLQVARAIDQRRGASAGADAPVSALELFRRASPVLTEGDLTLQSVSLGDDNSGVVLDILVPDFRALESVQSRLSRAGLQAVVQRSAVAPLGGVSASVTLIGAAP